MDSVSASEVPVEKLADFCESLEREVMKGHEKRFAERVRAVQEASNALGNTAARFASSVRNAWGSMDKAASEYGLRLAQIIQHTSATISRREVGSNYQDAEKFHEDSIEALNKIIVTVRKYIPKLHRGLKTEMAALNSSLAKLENSVRALGTSLDESPGTKIDSLRRDSQLLVQRHGEVLKLRTEEREQTASLEAISGRERELLADKQELSSQEEFLELKRYEDSLRLKADEIKQFFQPVVKPLLKLERAASTKQGSKIDIKTLHSLVDTPLDAIATGQVFAITELLTQLEEALRQGQLEVEERRRRKAEETIHRVKSGTTEKLREEYLTIQANVQETLRQLRARGLLEKRDRLDELLAEARGEKETVTARLTDLRRKIDDLSRNMLKQKGEIESQISKIAHRSVDIQVK